MGVEWQITDKPDISTRHLTKQPTEGSTYTPPPSHYVNSIICRGASSRTFSRWRMRCAQPIFSRPGVLLTVPSEIFGEGQVKATEDHLTTAHFWAINEFSTGSCTGSIRRFVIIPKMTLNCNHPSSVPYRPHLGPGWECCLSRCSRLEALAPIPAAFATPP